MAQLRMIRKAAAISLAISVGIGVASTANANAVATSLLTVSDFILSKGAGGAGGAVTVFDLTLGGITDNGTNSAKLTGFLDANSSDSSAGGAPLDVLQACVGAPCPAENTFAKTPAPSLGHRVLADSVLSGNPIVGLPGPLGASATTVADVILNGSAVGDADSDLGLLTTFTFVPAASGIFNLTFTGDLYLRAALSGDLPPGFGSNATATSKLTFTLRNLSAGGVTVFSWTPDGAGGGITGGTELLDPHTLNTTLTSPLPGFNFFSDTTGVYSADTGTLDEGVLYQFDISHVVGANAKQIPEPGTLMLLGVAIAGLGLSRRLKKAK